MFNNSSFSCTTTFQNLHVQAQGTIEDDGNGFLQVSNLLYSKFVCLISSLVCGSRWYYFLNNLTTGYTRNVMLGSIHIKMIIFYFIYLSVYFLRQSLSRFVYTLIENWKLRVKSKNYDNLEKNIKIVSWIMHFLHSSYFLWFSFQTKSCFCKGQLLWISIVER